MNATINGKPLQIVASAAWHEKFAGLEATLYTKEVLDAAAKKAVDMYVFETKDNVMTIRCAGYDLATDSVLDEETVLFKEESLPTPTFWFKIDNMGDKYVGTWLFPEDY